MQRAYYSSTIENFLADEPVLVLGQLVRRSEFAVEQPQRDAWLTQIDQLKSVLKRYSGSIYFEYAIPRMGKRADVVLVTGSAVFVLEYKVGEDQFAPHNVDQVVDYALDLKNFHETSHDRYIAPVFIATRAPHIPIAIALTQHNDRLFAPIKSNGDSLGEIIRSVLERIGDEPAIHSFNHFGRPGVPHPSPRHGA